MTIFVVSVLLVHIFLGFTVAQDFGEQCLDKFKSGRENFILDADESVNEGATFIASPKVERYKDCVRSCCKNTQCNVAFMERGKEEGLVKSCFLFDCLYKNKYVCRFVKKEGYINYILDSVYESDLAVKTPTDEDDRPPVADGGPDRVIQPPDVLTLNGIQSHDDHKIVSYEWTMVSGSHSVVIQKSSTFPDQVTVSNLASGLYKFKLTVKDVSDQTDSTQVTVLVLTPEQSEDHCMVPMKIGPCRGSFPRWHYNAASEKCEKFNFGGCRENLNNYLTFEECETACNGSETHGISGRGLTSPRKGEKCGSSCTEGQFTCTSGCCLDPGLECDGEKQCSDGSDEANCEDLNNKFRILLQIPVDEQKVRCTEPPQTGSCRDSYTMWYYHPVHQYCFRFNYGGCHGNKNRFESEDVCMKTCRGVSEKDIFLGKESFERSVADSETGIIVIAAILGLAILVLLGVLAYCYMKGKKRQPQHQRVAVNGSQLTTTEDTERLVYNSTTKPI